MVITFFPDMLIVLAITLLATALGSRLFNVFKFEFQSEFEKAILSSGMGFFLFAYFTLFMGLAGLLYRSVFYAFVFFAALVSRKEIVFLLHKLREFFQKLKRIEHLPAHYYLLAFLILTLLLRIIFNYAPLTDTDELIYQLSFPDMYIRHHAIIYRPDNFLTYLPQGMSMLYAFVMLISGGAMAAKLMALMFGVYSTMLIFCIAVKFLSSRSALLSAAIFYFLPPVIANFGMARVEFGFLFFSLLAFLAFLNFTGGADKRLIFFMALMTGMSIFIKITNGPFAITLFLFLSWHMLFTNPRPLKEYLKWIFAFALIVFLVPLPWFVRNFMLTGSPFPFMSFFGLPVDKMYQMIDGSMNRALTITAPDYLKIVFKLFFANPVNSPGPLLVAFSLPLLFFKRINPDIKRLAKFIFVNFAILILMLPATNKWTSRYYYLIFALMSIISAYGIEKISVIVSRKVLYSILFGNILFPGIFFNAFFGIKRIPVFLGLQSKSEYLLREYQQGYMTGSYAIVEYANKYIPANSKILSIGDSVFTYPFYYRADIFAAHPELLEMADYKKVLKRIKDEGFTHILFFQSNYKKEDAQRYKSSSGSFLDIHWDIEQLLLVLKPLHQELNGNILLYEIK